MKLKTLNDLRTIQAAIDDFGSTWTNTNQLRAETIKWVKDRLEKASKFTPPSTEFTYNMAQAKVMRDFHNITEEDLLNSDGGRT